MTVQLRALSTGTFRSVCMQKVLAGFIAALPAGQDVPPPLPTHKVPMFPMHPPFSWLLKLSMQCPDKINVTPVPASGTICGLPAPLSRMLSEAVRVPETLGLNVIVMLQLALLAS